MKKGTKNLLLGLGVVAGAMLTVSLGTILNVKNLKSNKSVGSKSVSKDNDQTAYYI